MTSRQQLKEVIDVDKEIQLFQQNKLKLLNAKTLYNEGMFIYRHYREEQMCVIGENSCSINLISSDSLKEIIKLNMNLMHMGLIVIGIKGLTRKKIRN